MKQPLLISMLVLLTSSTIATNAYSCEFHDGFGGSLWSRHGHTPRIPIHAHSIPQVAERPKIELTAPTMISATRNEKIELPIRYSYTGTKEAPTIELLIDTNAKIAATDGKNALLVGERGLHTFVVMPKAKGTYRVMVTARVTDLPDSSERRKVIYIKVV